jgi:hypothetical protein
MAYLIFITAAGHRLAVSPRKQKVMFRDIQDAVAAEAMVGRKSASYNRYRASRGITEDSLPPINVSVFARKQLEQRDDDAFRRIDAGIVRLQERPRARITKPKYYRWFIGDLRRVLIDEFPVLYSFDEKQRCLTILLLGLPRWKRIAKGARSALKRRKSG